MQVPEQVKKSVVFLGCLTKSKGFKLGGTAFFVSVALKKIYDQNLAYLITARHVIDEIKKESVDGKVYIRANMVNDTVGLLSTKPDDWVPHKDKSIDVSVLPWSPPQDKIDYLGINSEDMAITKEVIKKEEIGAGDEIFLTGLFYNHFGKKKNMPIIRAGNIAMLPDEKVYVGNKLGEIEAYLVESRSIGGLSGSPVFVYLGAARLKNNSLDLSERKLYYWLGLMHGHWNIDKKKADSILKDSDIDDRLHSGIAVVIPASKIMEVLNYDEFVEKRNQIEQKYINEMKK